MGVLKFSIKMLNLVAKESIFYFVSIIISMAIIYNSLNIVVSDNILGARGIDNQVITNIPFFLALLICVFTFYANSYFVINKTKELAIAALCGISSGELTGYFLVQNFVIEILGGFFGIILGILIQPIYIEILYKYLSINGSVWLINKETIFGALGILLLQLLYITAGDFAYISSKEIKFLMTLEKQVYTPDTRKIKVNNKLYLIVYCIPFVTVFLGVNIIPLDMACSIYSIYGIVRYYIPNKLLDIKEKKYSGNKIYLVSLSNLYYSLKRLTFLILILSSVIPVVLGLLMINKGSSVIKIMSIFTYCSIIVLIAVCMVYKLLIEANNRMSSFKNLLLIGYTKAEVKKVIFSEIILFYCIAAIMPLLHVLVYVFIFKAANYITISIGLGLILSFVLMFGITELISYRAYKNCVFSTI
jgi:putative ABC transport system permease protein